MSDDIDLRDVIRRTSRAVRTGPLALQRVQQQPYFCPKQVEFDDPWANTDCKLPNGHDGPCSALYPGEGER